MTPIIKIENLGKKYYIGHQRAAAYTTFRESVAEGARRFGRRLAHPFGKSAGAMIDAANIEEFWALKDLSLDIQQGDRVGIIGRNGAGKSTLLKSLSRITEPTTGTISIAGRMASLLEVGTGFHPELSGRENIFLNGAILGMKRKEIARKFGEIVEFAEVEKFLDTPVKRYSSGMYVRLAFAVAAHLEPEILIVDEVLAVGDMRFQKKCLGKMEDVSSREGRTVLFVSHNMGAVQRLCNRGILLADGRMAFQGSSGEAVEKYVKEMSDSMVRRVSFKDDPEKDICFLEAAVLSPGKGDSEDLDISDQIEIEIKYRIRKPLQGSNIAMAVSHDGITIIRSWDIDKSPELFHYREAGDYTARIALPMNILGPGIYSIYLSAGIVGVGPIVTYNDCLFFELKVMSLREIDHAGYTRDTLLVIPLQWRQN